MGIWEYGRENGNIVYRDHRDCIPIFPTNLQYAIGKHSFGCYLPRLAAGLGDPKIDAKILLSVLLIDFGKPPHDWAGIQA